MIARPINKRMLSSILQEIIFPFYAKLKNDERINNYIFDDETVYRLKFKQTMLSYCFLTCSDTNESFKEKFVNAGKIHENISLAPELLDEYGTLMFALYEEWIEKHLNPSQSEYKKWKEKIATAKEHLLCEYSPIDFKEDEFFTFDSEDVDDSINQMHYAEKIDASFYMSTQEIDGSEVDELSEICDDFDNLITHYEILNDELLGQSISLFEEFAKFYERSYEFKDIGYGIRELIVYLRDLNTNELEQTQLEMLYLYINAIGKELNSWKDSVLIRQDAKDIHYLDASLLANITQLKMALDNSKQEEAQEELEFF